MWQFAANVINVGPSVEEQTGLIKPQPRALAVGEATLGTDHLAIAGILDRLAEAYLAAGQPSRAAEFRGRALDLRIRTTSQPGLRR